MQKLKFADTSVFDVQKVTGLHKRKLTPYTLHTPEAHGRISKGCILHPHCDFSL